MTEPERLFDCSIEPVERRILQTGREVVASAEARAQTLRALGLLDTLAEPKVVSLAKRRARILLAALSVSTLVAAMPLGYWAIQSGFAKAARPPAAEAGPRDPHGLTDKETTNVPQPVLAPATEAQGSGQSAPAPFAETPSAEGSREITPRETGRTTLDAPRATKSQESRPVAANLLTIELAALDAARKKLNSGDAAGALSLLEGYDREFPRPRLALEAEVLRIFAYDSAGQTALAKKRAAAFVARHPKGVLTARVRRYLGQ